MEGIICLKIAGGEVDDLIRPQIHFPQLSQVREIMRRCLCNVIIAQIEKS